MSHTALQLELDSVDGHGDAQPHGDERVRVEPARCRRASRAGEALLEEVGHASGGREGRREWRGDNRGVICTSIEVVVSDNQTLSRFEGKNGIVWMKYDVTFRIVTF